MTIAPHLTSWKSLSSGIGERMDPVARSQWQILWLLAAALPTAEVAQVTGYAVRWMQEIARRYRAGPEAIGDHRHTNPGAAAAAGCGAAGAVACRAGRTRAGWGNLDRPQRGGAG